MTYRHDIDGLRALAVISVVAYHAGFLESGYLGVDIFFVISGYLITGILLRRETSLLEFYRRRAMRLLPGLVLVSGVSGLVSWLLLAPEEMIEFGQSVIAAILFVGNFFFYSVTSDYGAGTSQLKPFLHTWSLAVEEQFYIIFPLLVLAFRRNLRLVFGVVFLASLLFSAWLEISNPALNFYHPFSRAFEILVGALLALFPKFRAPQAVGWTGLGMLAVSFVLFDSTTPHPSPLTLLPVLGTAMVLCTEIGVLRFRPAVWVGVLSYSFYLWHFPIFAFVRLDNQTPEFKDFAAAALVALLLAALSYYCVERPFRRGGKWHLWATAIGSLGALAFAASATLTGFEQRVVKRVVVKQEEAINEALGEACMTTPCRHEGAGPRIAFLGDSHARVLAATMQPDLLTYARHYNFANSCPFFSGGQGHEECTPEQQELRFNALADFRPDVIILSSRLAGYLRGHFFEGGDTIKLTKAQISDGISRLTALAPVIAVYPTPAFKRGVVHSVQLTGESSVSRSEFDDWSRDAFELLDGADVIRFEPHQYLCDEVLCFGYRDGQVLFFDDDHMSAAAIDLFKRDFYEAVNGALQPDSPKMITLP